jgi:alcohol dehydrogenase, propanol-preferring
MTTMKAAVVPELGAKLEIQELTVPEPGPGQVLVKIEASGLCHTDIHAAHGDWPVKPNPPFIPGHEGVGVVIATGPGATLHKSGDRVAIAWLGSACGHCDYCVAGWETLCEAQQNSGYSVDGSYAEYAVADDRYVVDVPDEVSSFDAAPLTCAGVTTFKAVKVARLQPGETALIVGIGGLGHLALQYARVFGGRVIAVDVEDAKLDLARALGADLTVNARTTDPVQAIDAPMFVKGLLLIQVWNRNRRGLDVLRCGHDRDGPLAVEGRLLSGHEVSRPERGSRGGRQIVRRPARLRQPNRGSDRPGKLRG